MDDFTKEIKQKDNSVTSCLDSVLTSNTSA